MSQSWKRVRFRSVGSSTEQCLDASIRCLADFCRY
jgi:hypothetical protein